MTEQQRLMLIDGHALIYRAFHALPENLSTSKGEPTNAILGFCNIVLKAIDLIQPTHMIMALDRAAPTFRHVQYAEYKANRPATPPPLVPQFARVRQLAEAMNIPLFESDGFEADDILGTLSTQAETLGVKTVIVTGDLDALQLVTDSVHVLTPGRGVQETELYDRNRVRQRFGIDPEHLPDWKALVGDTSDNIPGVAGIGAKTASKLLADFQTLEEVYEHLGDIPDRQSDLLLTHHDLAFRSRALATIVRDAPVNLDLDLARRGGIDRVRLLSLLRDLEFWSLVRRFQDSEPGTFAGDDEPQQMSMFAEDELPPGSQYEASTVRGMAPRTDTRIASTSSELDLLLDEIRGAKRIAFDTETTDTDPMNARLVGMSFSVQADRAWYVPVGHVDGAQLPLEHVLEALRPFLEDARIPKVGHNLKYDYQVMAVHGVALRGLEFDTMIAAYLANPISRGLSLSALSLSKLDTEMMPIERVIGKGRRQVTMDRVSIESAAPYAGADADISLQLVDRIQPELRQYEVEALFRDVEMPLVPVLADMERDGVSLDTYVLAEMSADMTAVIGELEGRIYEHAGYRFNIKSTQQLGNLLFKQMKLQTGRRTKAGYSTDSDVLETLRDKDPIVADILEFRTLIKLRDTYVDALPALINARTGKVHTDFNQTAVSTGRLSSSNPNLQNIPVRVELGRQIRRAFVAGGEGRLLLAADYSQIELRVLASMSGDRRLLEAFNSGEDIHVATAAAVFGIPIGDVTSNHRRIAKIVNFGIIYGIGEARLARETGISRQEAAEFIAQYNGTYSGVKSFMDSMRRHAVLNGYVATMLKRRRPIPEIHSQNSGIRTAAERAAINMPIQGTAADIIKLAMIHLHSDLAAHFPDSHMILQVHDELVFDVVAENVEPISALVKRDMEQALGLDVPLEVEMKVGPNWCDMTPLKTAG